MTRFVSSFRAEVNTQPALVVTPVIVGVSAMRIIVGTPGVTSCLRFESPPEFRLQQLTMVSYRSISVDFPLGFMTLFYVIIRGLLFFLN